MQNFEEYISEDMRSSLKRAGVAAAASLLPLLPSAAEATPRPDITIVKGAVEPRQKTTSVVINKEFIDEIIQYEGNLNFQKAKGHFRNNKFYPYKDSRGFNTIGYGHKIIKGEVFTRGITEEQATALLLKDLRKTKEETDRLLKQTPVTQNAAKVVAHMVFQLGPTGTSKFKNMWQALKHQDYTKASYEMMNSKWARQTRTRAESLSRKMQRAHI